MNGLHSTFQRFLDLLRAGYEHTPQAELSQQWQWDVMRAVRNLGPLNAAVNPLLVLNQVTWRFASVAVAFAVMLSVYMASTGNRSGMEFVNQLLENPVEFVLIQAIGGY